MAARYGGRFLVIQVFVNTDENHEKVVKRIFNAARGIRFNAAVTTVAVHPSGPESEMAWNKIAEETARAAKDPAARVWKTGKIVKSN